MPLGQITQNLKNATLGGAKRTGADEGTDDDEWDKVGWREFDWSSDIMIEERRPPQRGHHSNSGIS